MSHGIHSVGSNRAELRAERQEARAERREARQAESAMPVESWGKSATTQEAPLATLTQSPGAMPVESWGKSATAPLATPTQAPTATSKTSTTSNSVDSVSRDALEDMRDLSSLMVLTRFDNIDTNHDNKLDRQEAMQGLSHDDPLTRVASNSLNFFFDNGGSFRA